jgi:hypothetical protein
MNDTRRKMITKIIDELTDLRRVIESTQEEEQEYFDNMPESLQSGEKGSKAEEAISALDEAITSLDEVVASLETAQE